MPQQHLCLAAVGVPIAYVVWVLKRYKGYDARELGFGIFYQRLRFGRVQTVNRLLEIKAVLEGIFVCF